VPIIVNDDEKVRGRYAPEFARAGNQSGWSGRCQALASRHVVGTPIQRDLFRPVAAILD
jgi:hypothetical protein